MHVSLDAPAECKTKTSFPIVLRPWWAWDLFSEIIAYRALIKTNESPSSLYFFGLGSLSTRLLIRRFTNLIKKVFTISLKTSESSANTLPANTLPTFISNPLDAVVYHVPLLNLSMFIQHKSSLWINSFPF